MTNITFYRNGKDIVKYTVEGHTEYAAQGEDIVCAAISTLAMSTLNGLTDVVGIQVGYEVRDAYVECILPKEMSSEEAKCSRVLMDTLYISLVNLEKQYGRYITITELEV